MKLFKNKRVNLAIIIGFLIILAGIVFDLGFKTTSTSIYITAALLLVIAPVLTEND